MNFKIRKYQFIDMDGNKFMLDNVDLINKMLYFKRGDENIHSIDLNIWKDKIINTNSSAFNFNINELNNNYDNVYKIMRRLLLESFGIILL